MARVTAVAPSDPPRGALVLGHGAGGGVSAPDLLAARDAALAAGFAVALVEQPYRVLGRRSPPPAPRLDRAWFAVCAELQAGGELAGLAQITGGRSSGARVACRTAQATGARGVLCLAFPLQPGPRGDGTPPPSRAAELDAAGVPVLVVQGDSDRFGQPQASRDRDVVIVTGDHGLKRDLPAIADAVWTWLSVQTLV